MDHYSLYTFDVCINGTKVKEHYHRDENVYIEGRRGSEFTLKFRNKTADKVLVVLSVDGLSVMDGKPASNKAGGYICEPFDTIVVPGWRIDNNKIAKFQFQPQGDRDNKTYVEELASEGFNVDPDNQGVIGIMVFKQVPPPTPVQHVYYYQHYNEPYYGAYAGNNLTRGADMGVGDSEVYNTCGGLVLASNMMSKNLSGGQTSIACSASTGQSSLGTAFGEEEKFRTSQTDFKRATIESWTGAIFYDTRSNLQKKGIVFEEVTVRTPNPFPSSNGCYVPKSRR